MLLFGGAVLSVGLAVLLLYFGPRFFWFVGFFISFFLIQMATFAALFRRAIVVTDRRVLLDFGLVHWMWSHPRPYKVAHSDVLSFADQGTGWRRSIVLRLADGQKLSLWGFFDPDDLRRALEQAVETVRKN